jgi:hypothetical protein
MKSPPLPAQLEDGQLREPHERLCDIDRRFVHVSERAAFRCDSGERRRWAWMMSAGNRASFSLCPPGTHWKSKYSYSGGIGAPDGMSE